MFRCIFIANRGEVAARVARTCKRLGIRVVAGVTEPDRALGWLQPEAGLVDEVALLGGRQGYLDADAILNAARAHHCAALHPGWGFLSENARFATRCEAERISFIGPSPASIRAMGDKSVAKETMKRLGMPLIPGSDGPVESVSEALEAADRIGYPVLLKARSGGGGRGMRRVAGPGELSEAFSQASAEALSAFGDGAVYLERLIERGRHVEFQVLGDAFGNVVCLGERECSVQRRHQKLVEESPSPGLDPARRQSVMSQVTAACVRAGYRGAGTVEMLMDEHGALYFMEMNTRLQVEHPVTELCTGVDLVEWQLRIAAGEPLPVEWLRDGVPVSGHAIECRINAEDPADAFRPAPGRVRRLVFPVAPGLRVDTHLVTGDTISPHYDSLIAKLIVHAPDRRGAIAAMDAALGALEIEGVPTTAALHRQILADPRFVAGAYDTSLLDGSPGP
ncbi:MAG: ATP-grasp domain-containing protein [Myxococcales bacterium]|nr:ATP-grasp domain-containing protein [Myxococcales bacterium]